jgi:hypothetical protein
MCPSSFLPQWFVTLNNVDMALAQSRKLYEEMKEDVGLQLKTIEVRLPYRN